MCCHLHLLLIIGLIEGAVHPIAVLFPFTKVEGRILVPRPSHIRPPPCQRGGRLSHQHCIRCFTYTEVYVVQLRAVCWGGW